MTVQVKETVLRENPSFLGRPVADLDYGDRVTVLQEKGSWSMVSAAVANGWVHTSALTRKRLEKKAGGRDLSAAASRDEIALAGKGFSEEVEDEYRQQNTQADFGAVDRMEKIVIPEVEMRDFLLEGGIIATEGGGA
jgi:hypothetical protein